MALHRCIQQRYVLAQLSIATAGQVTQLLSDGRIYRAIDNLINYFWPSTSDHIARVTHTSIQKNAIGNEQLHECAKIQNNTQMHKIDVPRREKWRKIRNEYHLINTQPWPSIIPNFAV